MSNVYVCSDLHFGHKNMAVKHRGFKHEEDHDYHIIEKWNEVVNKKDKVFILGDIGMESHQHYYKLDLLNGTKVVVLGNHDLPSHQEYLSDYVDKVAGMINYKRKAWLTHCPIHPEELRGKLNIHGHVHENSLRDKRYVNVSMDVINYTPQPLIELIEKNKQHIKR
jgi:calcineurin-like phosphoesterase family protein